jgi:hypothetical protein
MSCIPQVRDTVRSKRTLELPLGVERIELRAQQILP